MKNLVSASSPVHPHAVSHEVLAIARRALGPAGDEISLDSSAADTPGWDSGAMVAIVLAIEERYGFEMTSPELESLLGVGDLVRVTLSHLQGRDGAG